jgi:acyl phosphate:glycerol-3-phosphate acyltransferase
VTARAVMVVAAAAVLGSIPFSFIVARLFGVADVRTVGSGNVGATNVMRSAGPLPGVLAFVLDFAKGALAVLLAHWLAGGTVVPAAAAAASVLGHMYPPWLKFHGGKGVATGAGAFLPLAPLATGAGLLAFGVVLAVARYVSVASLAGALVLAGAVWALRAPEGVAAAATFMALLIAWKHRGNLLRVWQGTEHRVGDPRDPEGRP